MNAQPPRRLTDEEQELWSGVIRSIAPLRKKPAVAKQEHSGSPRPPRTAASTAKAVKLAAKTQAATPTQKPAPALAPLGRRMKQKLARGTEAIDARLDLHGMTQARAHAALLSFLRNAQDRGAKNVLIITGKGSVDGERGVLKRQVPQWLRLPEFRSLVVGIENAAIAHGGEGALYVRVRKSKE
jgi:DNA-nicking Smr family endonuclease